MKPASKPKAWPAREEGAVLLLIILVLALISVLVLSWAQEWRIELKLAANYRDAHKCRRLAEGGIYYALGKVLTAKITESARLNPFAPEAELATAPGSLWLGDQRPHILELPDGKVEIRIADEGGKINLNVAPEPVLHNLLAQLGLPEPQIRTMVDSILDWRASGDVPPRPYGAKSDHYLRLDPPYVAKNGRFETVEELAWVRGFEASPLIPRLSQWLTVQPTESSINLNTAPLPVLLTLGLAPAAAQTILASRETMPLRNLQEIPQMMANPLWTQGLQINFTSSSFYTIISTGIIKSGGRQTIKAIVHLEPQQEVPWKIESWYDGFPG
jgi:general secretion pathway protein K